MKRYSAFAAAPEIDGRAGPLAQLEVAGDEIGVEVREEDVRDPEAVFAGKGQVLLDVALRVDDGALSASPVSPTRYEACARHCR